MKFVSNIRRQVSAARIRHDMKKARRKHGLSTDLNDVIAEYRAISPEYAEKLERIIFPTRSPG